MFTQKSFNVSLSNNVEIREKYLSLLRVSRRLSSSRHNGMWTSYLGQGRFSFPQELYCMYYYLILSRNGLFGLVLSVCAVNDV